MKKNKILTILIMCIILIFITLFLYKENYELFENRIERFNKINHPVYGEIYVFDKNDTISNVVLTNNGIWEENISKIMAEHYIEGTDMLDIGANLGLNTLRMNQIKPITGTCHLFEPQSDVFTLLDFNTKKLKRKLYNFALSNNCGIVSFNQNDNNIGATKMSNNDDISGISVTSISLDSIPFTNKISLVKMDCEGFEINVLKGGKKFFNKYKPKLIIEMWTENVEEVTKELKNMNYVLLNHIGFDDYIFIYK